MFEQSLFNEQSLYLLTLKELRIMGRNFGVPSPTTKSKKELIDYILGVVYGKVKVPVRNVYGRKPTDNSFDVDKFIDKLKKNSEMTDEFKNLSILDNMGLAKVSSPTESYDTLSTLETKIYCFENNKHLLKSKVFIESPDDIEISEEFAKMFNLENLDVVEIIVRENLIKLVSVNGIKKKDNFSQLSIADQKLEEGSSKVFYLSTKEEIKKELNNLISSCEKFDIKPAIFSANEYKDNIISVQYLETEDKSQIYKKLMMFSGLCEKAVQSGQDIVIIFEDGNWLKSKMGEFEEDIYSRLEKNLVEIFTKITKLGNVLVSFDIEEEYTY